jgi:hypothetical protein
MVRDERRSLVQGAGGSNNDVSSNEADLASFEQREKCDRASGSGRIAGRSSKLFF